MKVVAVVVVGACVAVLSGCLPKNEPGCPACPGGGGGTPVLVMPFDTIDRGTYSGIRDARQGPIRDLEAWRTLWDEHVAGRVPPPGLPAVDFAREMMVGYFLGERPTSGYSAEIREVVLVQERLVVRVAVGSPPPGAPVLQVLTQPFHIVRLPRYDVPVEFVVVEAPGEGQAAR